MSLDHRQLHRLHRIESGLLRSDPHLAAMLAVFASLAAGEHLPAWEQLATRPDRIRQAVALTVRAVTLLAAAIALLVDAVRGLVRAAVMGDRARSRTEGTSAAQPRHDDQGWNPAQGS
jgi:hypothetical protein